MIYTLAVPDALPIWDLMWSVTMSDTAPPTQTREVSVEVVRKINGEIRKLNKLVDGPIATLNTKVEKAGVPAVIA